MTSITHVLDLIGITPQLDNAYLFEIIRQYFIIRNGEEKRGRDSTGRGMSPIAEFAATPLLKRLDIGAHSVQGLYSVEPALTLSTLSLSLSLSLSPSFSPRSH